MHVFPSYRGLILTTVSFCFEMNIAETIFLIDWVIEGEFNFPSLFKFQLFLQEMPGGKEMVE